MASPATIRPAIGSRRNGLGPARTATLRATQTIANVTTAASVATANVQQKSTTVSWGMGGSVSGLIAYADVSSPVRYPKPR